MYQKHLYCLYCVTIVIMNCYTFYIAYVICNVVAAI